MDALVDTHGRSFRYLRLSLTDACNFRCSYCLPQGYVARSLTGDPLEDTVLSGSEVSNLVRGFSSLGFKKVRLTGGEPTLRPDIVSIVESVASTPGIETVALTTNGYRLDTLAAPLRAAGLRAINVSLDSLDPLRFKRLTGSSHFDRVRAGVDRALSAGIESVKLNVVLLRDHQDELPAFLEFIRSTPVTVRFIELMETAGSQDFFRANYLAASQVRLSLLEQGWAEVPRRTLDGPAVEFAQAGYVGKVGLIAPYAEHFCANCNRLRVSSRGKLRLCLFGGGEVSLRPDLQSPDQLHALVHAIRSAVGVKPQAHRLHLRMFGDTQHLAGIGG